MLPFAKQMPFRLGYQGNWARREAACDVLFVHGLKGDAEDTWKSSDAPFYWPDQLAEMEDSWRISCMEYPSHLTRLDKSRMDLGERAQNLIDLLSSNGFGERPLYLIAHSMGGLLVKWLAAGCVGKDAAKIQKAIAGIVFCGTPHSGNVVVRALRFPFRMIMSPHLNDLSGKGKRTKWINDSFSDWCEKSKIPISVFYETHSPLLHSPPWRRASARWRGLIPVRIVGKASSDPGIAGAVVVPIDADHFALAKPNSTKCTIFSSVHEFIVAGTKHNAPRAVRKPVIVATGARHLHEAVSIFKGNDPIRGKAAIPELHSLSELELGDLLRDIPNSQVKSRVRELFLLIGVSAVPLLEETVRKSEWQTKLVAAELFAGVANTTAATSVVENLLVHHDFDMQRMGVMAAGYSGYSQSDTNCNFLAQLCFFGSVDSISDRGYRAADDYSLSKLGNWVVESVSQGFAQAPTSSKLSLIQKIFYEQKKRGYREDPACTAVVRGMDGVGPGGVKLLMEEWLSERIEPWASIALEVLGSRRFNRTIVHGGGILWSDSIGSRESAGRFLAGFGNLDAAFELAESVRLGARLDGAARGFAPLYCWRDVTWRQARKLKALVSVDPNASAELLVSRAMRREKGVNQEALAWLSSGDRHRRSAGALALSYGLGSRALPILEVQTREAEKGIETMYLAAARSLAGDDQAAGDLHNSLMAFPDWPYLGTFWRRHILAALISDGNFGREYDAWAHISGDQDEDTRRIAAAFRRWSCG